jgi:hypothetical protein
LRLSSALRQGRRHQPTRHIAREGDGGTKRSTHGGERRALQSPATAPDQRIGTLRVVTIEFLK